MPDNGQAHLSTSTQIILTAIPVIGVVTVALIQTNTWPFDKPDAKHTESPAPGPDPTDTSTSNPTPTATDSAAPEPVETDVPPPAPPATLSRADEAIFSTLALSVGFTPDPHTVTLQAGGDVGVSAIGGNCNGYTTASPHVRLSYDGGEFPIVVSVTAEGDTTLIINNASGSWVCDDDSGGSGNPSITFSPGQGGTYEIWVGTYGAGENFPADLHISEMLPQ